jgi:DNA-binding MarR family transcriptional regulator
MADLKELRRKPGHLLWRAQQLGWQRFAEEVQDANITPVQEVVLFTLRLRPKIDLKTLAALVALDRSTIGDVVSRLEQRGLIDRVPDENDRRAWSLSLTRSGETFTDKLAPVTRKAVDRFLAAITPREREELMRILRKLVGMADSVDLQDVPDSRNDRLAGKSIVIFGRGPLSDELSSRLSTQGALVSHFALEDAESVSERDKQLNRLRKEQKPSSIVITSDDLARLAPTYDDYGSIDRALSQRASVLKSAIRVLHECEFLRIVPIGLFVADETREASMNAIVALNHALLAMTETFYPACLDAGITLTSVTPRATASFDPASAVMQTFSTPVTVFDIAACICFLTSNDARVVAESTIRLGMAPSKR